MSRGEFKKRGLKSRNLLAIDAEFRNSAGPMKMKQQKEEKYKCRKFRHEWREYAWEESDESQEEPVSAAAEATEEE